MTAFSQSRGISCHEITPEYWRSKFGVWYIPEPNTGCWLWMRACHKKTGYGVTSRNRLSHRVAYQMWRGQIPDGLSIDHLCRTRSCVNPDHLEVVTDRENILRGVSPSANNARKTHCCNGHEFNQANVRLTSDGKECRTCRMEITARYRMAHRDAYNVHQRAYRARRKP